MCIRDRFIPALEESGFVVTLDKYIWQGVASWLRERIDRGLRVVPVSLNVSRVDILACDVDVYKRQRELLTRTGTPDIRLKHRRAIDDGTTRGLFAFEPRIAARLHSATHTLGIARHAIGIVAPKVIAQAVDF